MHHYQLFSKCRIPGPEADTVKTTPISDSRHILVLRNGHVRFDYNAYHTEVFSSFLMWLKHPFDVVIRMLCCCFRYALML